MYKPGSSAYILIKNRIIPVTIIDYNETNGDKLYECKSNAPNMRFCGYICENDLYPNYFDVVAAKRMKENKLYFIRADA